MADNSPIRAPGIGKDAKRHDLDGTPGLQGSDLQYGDVQELEAGQKAVENTVAQQQRSIQPVPGVQAPAPSMSVPDPISFATKKLAGTAKDGMAGAPLEMKARQNWLPFLERIASSPTSSGILQRAYVQRLRNELQRPTGGQSFVLRQREMDQRLREFNER